MFKKNLIIYRLWPCAMILTDLFKIKTIGNYVVLEENLRISTRLIFSTLY